MLGHYLLLSSLALLILLPVAQGRHHYSTHLVSFNGSITCKPCPSSTNHSQTPVSGVVVRLTCGWDTSHVATDASGAFAISIDAKKDTSCKLSVERAYLPHNCTKLVSWKHDRVTSAEHLEQLVFTSEHCEHHHHHHHDHNHQHHSNHRHHGHPHYDAHHHHHRQHEYEHRHHDSHEHDHHEHNTHHHGHHMHHHEPRHHHVRHHHDHRHPAAPPAATPSPRPSLAPEAQATPPTTSYPVPRAATPESDFNISLEEPIPPSSYLGFSPSEGPYADAPYEDPDLLSPSGEIPMGPAESPEYPSSEFPEAPEAGGPAPSSGGT